MHLKMAKQMKKQSLRFLSALPNAWIEKIKPVLQKGLPKTYAELGQKLFEAIGVQPTNGNMLRT